MTLMFCINKENVEDLGDCFGITIQEDEAFLLCVLKARANPCKIILQ